MIIQKVYAGDMIGTGLGQMLSKRIEGGAAVYAAIEEFSGSVKGKTGSFTLFHRGCMSATTQSLDIDIVEGSGTDELEGIQGSLSIHQENGEHLYTLNTSNDT